MEELESWLTTPRPCLKPSERLQTPDTDTRLLPRTRGEPGSAMTITPGFPSPLTISTAHRGPLPDPLTSYSRVSAEVSPFYLKGISSRGVKTDEAPRGG